MEYVLLDWFKTDRLTKFHGAILVDLVQKELKKGKRISLDFKDIKEVTPSFVSKALVPLMERYLINGLGEKVEIKNATYTQRMLIFNVLWLVREYTKDEEFRHHVDELISRKK
ncbi:STAS-like domain-containing protein (plasmid) [Pontibacillus sp. ALD_SL1]|uniref:STAS-like domain-containing protein n=1 Tax=Pontibacillus sp. ALD_SL1 TaxID=2777185 RepID=UPI001A968A65|nr:STAS-like domain-containing protein [Pontibacillus sp. ALD_SL1]QST02078.1 STAS-like domain-containing protein [Pontibacillus sp. ALD_SL1]